MPGKTFFLLASLTLVSLIVYLSGAAYFYRIGFPLDDSWIHLTYARNLALHGEWSFFTGQNSAGSTSPLWTFLLAFGFFLPGAPYLWTYFLGGLMLFLLAWRVEAVLRSIQPAYVTVMPWVGMVIIFEWHLAWAAVSGMEIVLHALLVTSVLSFLILNQPRFLLSGILTGLSVWARPDGVTLLGPLVLFVLFQRETLHKKVVNLGKIFLGFAGFFGPYLLFNLLLAGTPWPNTFYAKQAEYASWQAESFYVKLGELFSEYSIGVSLVLLPAVVLILLSSWRKRNWGALLSFVWLAGYSWLYTDRLPLYQYGRYIMPTIPIFILLGLVYIITWYPDVRTRVQRQLRFAWLALIGLMSIILWFYGAYFYAKNVGWIESEMVQTAHWSARNLPQNALVAVHDIGALGYFDNQRKVIDLAGLISPDVIPFIQDEERLAQYLSEQNATHMIVFPDWYPELVKSCQPIFEADGPEAGLSGLGKMTVYDCQKP